MFTARQIHPGILHITDAMGVSFTLICGRDRAILFDTGYGMEDVGSYVRSLTDKPVKVLLSHGHHDHILGARFFPESWMSREDMDEFRLRTGPEQRTKVMKQAADRGVRAADDFMSAPVALPRPLSFSDRTAGFESFTEDLGGLIVRVIHVPGHTPGSIVLYLPELRMLLTGDDWNPCTWIWFPSSEPVIRWRNHMMALVRGLESTDGTILQVLCSHQPEARQASEMKAFLIYMTDERLDTAPAVDMNCQVNTHAVHKDPEGWVLLFDRDKLHQ